LSALLLILLGLAFGALECLLCGPRLVFCLPAYGILGLAALASLIALRKPRVRPDWACLAASALFFGYVIGRSLASPVVYLAWFDRYLALAALVVYLLTACYLTDPRRRLWLIGWLLAIAAVNLAIAARQFSGGDDFMLFGFVRADQYRGRGSGLYVCPDHLAGFLEMVAPLALSAAFWSRCPGWVRMLFGYSAACCYLGLLLTLSRGGAISATAGLTVLTILGLWRAWARGGVVRSLVTVVILAALLAGAVSEAVLSSDSLQRRAKQLLDRGDIRLILWPAAIAEFKLHPVFGGGSASYRHYGRMFRDPRVQTDPIRSHNDYFELLAEYGAAGGAGLLVFLAAHARRGLRVFRSFAAEVDSLGAAAPFSAGASNAVALNIGSLAAIAALVVHSVVDFNMHIAANAMLMAFIFGMIANPGKALAEDPRGSARVRGAWDFLPRLALPALGLWLLLEGMPKIPGEYYCEKARVALRDKHELLAEHEAELGIEWEKNNPFLYFYLGEARQTIAGSGPDNVVSRSFREASLEPYREGLRLYPEDSPLLLRYGEALTRLGDLEGAGKVFEQVLIWDPHSAVAETYYGFYLQCAGHTEEAKNAYHQALSWQDVPFARENLERLERLQPGAKTH
jgi:O-antigen ligase